VDADHDNLSVQRAVTPSTLVAAPAITIAAEIRRYATQTQDRAICVLGNLNMDLWIPDRAALQLGRLNDQTECRV
jgi:hypothetical protein